MYQIVTDSCCDLPCTYLKEEDVPFISMTIELEGQELVDDLGETFNYEAFLQKIKTCSRPTTSQVNVGRYSEFFRPFVEKQIPVVYLAFSSGLSGSYHSAVQAVTLLKEEYPTAEIQVIDTKAASLGQGLLVREAIHLKKQGHTLNEVVASIEELKWQLHSWVTVDDLNYLERGGRISKSAAAIGGLINIKPIIRVDKNGQLQAVGKARGRKKALAKIVSETVAEIENPSNQTLLIAYAGAQVDAQSVQALLLKEIPVADILLYPLGPTMTSHTGYGCIALFSLGKKRC